MIIAHINPHHSVPRLKEDSSQRIKRIATEAAKKAQESDVSYNVIVPVKTSGDPFTRYVPAGLTSEPALTMIRASLQDKDCTVLVGSLTEVTNALAELGIEHGPIIDERAPVFSAFITSLLKVA